MITIEKVISSFNRIRYFYIRELNKNQKFISYSPNEISILLALDNNPNINTASDLCFALSVSKGLVSRSIDSLIAKGLILSEKHKNDKRIVCLTLTDNGKKIAKDMFKKMEEINHKINLNFNQDELEIVNNTFKKIINYFENMEGSVFDE